MKYRYKALLVTAIAAMTFGTGCGYSDTATNEIGLVYSGGVVEDKSFKGLLKSGATFEHVGFGSRVYRYRTDQRSYIAGSQRGVDSPPVEIVSEDDVRLQVDYQLYFKLNQREEVLRRFHENLGVKTEAWTNDGWVQLLNEYFAPQIERSLEAAALKHPWRQLYASEEARRAFNADTVATLKVAIQEVIGADYFCGPAYRGGNSECGDFTFTVGKPKPTNAEIVQAIEAEQTAVTQTVAQEQENLRIAKELEGKRQEVALYGPEGAVLLEAIRSGKVQSIIVDEAGRATVPGR